MFAKKRNNYSLYKPGNSRRRSFRRFLRFLVTAVIAYELITAFLLTSVRITTDSMDPTLAKNDIVISLPVYYGKRIFNIVTVPGIRKPMRGDIVIYKPSTIKKLPWYLKLPDSVYRFVTFQRKSISDHTEYSDFSSVKRIIALPGDTVSVKNNVMYVKEAGSENQKSEFEIADIEYNINFSRQPDNWGSRQNPFSGNFDDITLRKDEYFLLGDNRDLTSDSRNISPAKVHDISGKLVFRYWPLKRIHVF